MRSFILSVFPYSPAAFRQYRKSVGICSRKAPSDTPENCSCLHEFFTLCHVQRNYKGKPGPAVRTLKNAPEYHPVTERNSPPKNTTSPSLLPVFSQSPPSIPPDPAPEYVRISRKKVIRRTLRTISTTPDFLPRYGTD